jgi:zinc/manganese transport system substrate-binding protein
MKSRYLAFLFAVAVGLTLSAPAFAKKLNIVTTTTDLASIAEAVGGDKVEVTSICTGRQDPHFVEAKPSYMMKAKAADLFIRVGLELEIGYEQPIIDGSRNRKIRIGSPGHLDVSKGVRRLEVPGSKVTRAMGDVHPLGNPHYWLDPYNARVVAKNIADRLGELSPGDADYFKDKLSSFQSHIDNATFGEKLVKRVGAAKLWSMSTKGTLADYLTTNKLSGDLGGWMKKMWPYRGRKIVTYHRSWSYFVDRFGLTVADELEPKPGIPPSPGHVAEVINRMKAEKIKALVMEPFYDRKPADLVAGKTGARVVVVANSVGGDKGAGDYFGLMTMIVDRISSALSG